MREREREEGRKLQSRRLGISEAQAAERGRMWLCVEA